MYKDRESKIQFPVFMRLHAKIIALGGVSPPGTPPGTPPRTLIQEVY